MGADPTRGIAVSMRPGGPFGSPREGAWRRCRCLQGLSDADFSQLAQAVRYEGRRRRGAKAKVPAVLAYLEGRDG